MQFRRSEVGVLLLLAASAAPLLGAMRVDPRESRRFVGREDDVRVDAQLVATVLKPNGPVRVIFEIQNFRKESIAFDPTTTACDYDPTTGTATLIVGAEIPDAKKPPHLVVINSGEKRTFSAGARMEMPITVGVRPQPRLVQVKLNYLSDVKPFGPLLAATAPKSADDYFPAWVENNVVVVTNSLPFDFASVSASTPGDASQQRGSAAPSGAIGSF